jgi:hypothetical protein
VHERAGGVGEDVGALRGGVSGVAKDRWCGVCRQRGRCGVRPCLREVCSRRRRRRRRSSSWAQM